MASLCQCKSIESILMCFSLDEINFVYKVKHISSKLALEVSAFDSGKVELFHYLWLRDHCRCDECYNHVTFQRKKTILEQPEHPDVKEHTLDKDSLKVTWNDDHVSEFSVQWLLENTYNNSLQKLKENNAKVFWKKDTIGNLNIAKVPCEEYMTQKDVQKKVVESLLKYGVAMVTNVEPTEAATEVVVSKLFPVQHTLFGAMWSFSDKMDHNDTAYTTHALGAHTDNTYFTEAAGLQILHCVKHTGSGGENLLIDAFDVAKQISEEDPEMYSRLISRNVPAEYIESGCHYTATGPVFKLHPVTGELEQIRFNIYDRSPLTLPVSDIPNFYADMRKLSVRFTEPSVEWWFKLSPGTVLFFDNWRVLHGRAAYTGHREMTGCYVSRADWLSKAKALGFTV